MVTVAIAVVGQLGASIWLAATLTHNDAVLSRDVNRVADRLDEAASSNYNMRDARADKEIMLELHEEQAEKIRELTQELSRIAMERAFSNPSQN